MGAAWRSPKDRDLDRVCEMVESVKSLGLETCVTLGMLNADQATRLKEAGLDYYNHNLDTSEAFYGHIIKTRTYRERLDTLAHVRDAGIKVCCGGIIGMGEQAEDRVDLLVTLANLPVHPESVPINLLVQVGGTPLAGTEELDPLEFASANEEGKRKTGVADRQFAFFQVDDAVSHHGEPPLYIEASEMVVDVLQHAPRLLNVHVAKRVPSDDSDRQRSVQRGRRGLAGDVSHGEGEPAVPEGKEIVEVSGERGGG